MRTSNWPHPYANEKRWVIVASGVLEDHCALGAQVAPVMGHKRTSVGGLRAKASPVRQDRAPLVVEGRWSIASRNNDPFAPVPLPAHKFTISVRCGVLKSSMLRWTSNFSLCIYHRPSRYDSVHLHLRLGLTCSIVPVIGVHLWPCIHVGGRA